MNQIELLPLVIVIVSGYLLGSLSTSLMVSKIVSSMDIREHGSGNAGMTNVLRVMGKKAAFWVIAGDVIKTVAAVMIGKMLLGDIGGWIAGLCCVIGHVFPLYFQFKGGKGVLTSVTVIACMDWRLFIITISVFIIVVILSKMVSLGSVIAAFSIFPSLFFLDLGVYGNVIMVLIALMVIIKHHANIKRILQGTESKITAKKEMS